MVLTKLGFPAFFARCKDFGTVMLDRLYVERQFPPAAVKVPENPKQIPPKEKMWPWPIGTETSLKID